METFFRMFSQEPRPACGLDLIEAAKQVYNHWSDGFLGGSLQALKWTLLVNEALIRAAESNDLLQEYYSKSLNLLQSSGTGKSKLLDELAKDNFTFTFVFRKENDTGFPPGDNEISRFLSNRSNPAWIRVAAFFAAVGLSGKSKTSEHWFSQFCSPPPIGS